MKNVQQTFSTAGQSKAFPELIREKWGNVGQAHCMEITNVYSVAKILNFYRKNLKGVKYGVALQKLPSGSWFLAVALNVPDVGEKDFVLSLARYLRRKHGKDYDLFTSKPMKVSKTFRKMLKEMETALVSKSTLKLHSLLLEI